MLEAMTESFSLAYQTVLLVENVMKAKKNKNQEH